MCMDVGDNQRAGTMNRRSHWDGFGLMPNQQEVEQANFQIWLQKLSLISARLLTDSAAARLGMTLWLPG